MKLESDDAFGNALLQIDRINNTRASAVYYSTDDMPDWYTGLLAGGTSNDFHIGTSVGISEAKVTVTSAGNPGIVSWYNVTKFDLNHGADIEI